MPTSGQVTGFSVVVVVVVVVVGFAVVVAGGGGGGPMGKQASEMKRRKGKI